MTTPASERRHVPRIAAALAAFSVMLTACGDDPFQFNWSDIPDTTTIFSLARPELNIASAYSFYDRVAFAVESPSATGRWDAALDTRDDELVLLPPGALGIVGRAGIATFQDTDYDDVRTAPSDTLAYEVSDPVSVAAGNIYVIRTHQHIGSYGSACVYYAKMEPLDIDVVGGSLTFRYVTSPICNSRDLVPPN